MKDLAPPPHALDVQALCRSGARLQGREPLRSFTRLLEGLTPGDDGAGQVVWSAQGEQRPVRGGPAQDWLHLQAEARVWLQCQRCLQPWAQPLSVQRAFCFVATEAQAEALDEELEDDVLVMPRRLDLIELLEDELILSLPLVPRHEPDCPAPLLALASATSGGASADEAPHPFAALADWARKGREPPG